MDTGQMYAGGATQHRSFADAKGRERGAVRRKGWPRGSRSHLSEAAYMELVPDGVRVGFKKEGRDRDGVYHLLLMEGLANQFLEGKTMPKLVFEVGSDDDHHLVEMEFVAGKGETATFQRDGVHTEQGVTPVEKVLSMTMIWESGWLPYSDVPPAD
jgi:hypothetical protein